MEQLRQLKRFIVIFGIMGFCTAWLGVMAWSWAGVLNSNHVDQKAKRQPAAVSDFKSSDYNYMLDQPGFRFQVLPNQWQKTIRSLCLDPLGKVKWSMGNAGTDCRFWYLP